MCTCLEPCFGCMACMASMEVGVPPYRLERLTSSPPTYLQVPLGSSSETLFSNSLVSPNRHSNVKWECSLLPKVHTVCPGYNLKSSVQHSVGQRNRTLHVLCWLAWCQVQQCEANAIYCASTFAGPIRTHSHGGLRWGLCDIFRLTFAGPTRTRGHWHPLR